MPAAAGEETLEEWLKNIGPGNQAAEQACKNVGLPSTSATIVMSRSQQPGRRAGIWAQHQNSVPDALGRITRKDETMGGPTNTFLYGYDNAGRLKTIQKNGAVVHDYGYDANGNRLTDNGVLVGTYDAQDRLTQYESSTAAFAFGVS